MDYKPREIERKWLAWWKENAVYKVETDRSRPKYYVLDMFPYPSGAGLHVGHPLGYIASDILARYKRLRGFNVLHPMGFDAFGLPAEQYAMDNGIHPEVSTNANIERYIEQLENIGFSFDWSREVRTSDPSYYKWTQWIFLEMFDSWYSLEVDKALKINELVSIFEKEGNQNVRAATTQEAIFTAADWASFSEKERDDVLMNYRLMYRKTGYVNWCEALGTVLANDEVVGGVSERGGHPVEIRPMLQWSMRILAYAERLLSGLDRLDFPESLKAMQRAWIGRSEGAQVFFDIAGHDEKLEIFTTRPDTIFGATFMVLAPELDLVEKITTAEQRISIENYVNWVKSRSEIERMSDKTVSGAATGAFAVHPFSGEKIPIFISEYVLKSYGTGAIMAVPADDERDERFAQKFGLPVVQIVDKTMHPSATIEDKLGQMVNSDFLNGLEVVPAIQEIIARLEKMGIGRRRINYKLRDANYSRQRYWGEPFPIVFDEKNVARPVRELPVELPPMAQIKSGVGGKGPLSNLTDWMYVKKESSESNFIEKQTKIGSYGQPQETTTPERWKFLKDFARSMRKKPTEAEAMLWQQLRDKKLGGYKFRRQHAINDFIVDFVNLETRLVIEIDGTIHDFQPEYDALRSELLGNSGFQVIRFSNEDVVQNLKITLQTIQNAVEKRSAELRLNTDTSLNPTPDPSPKGGRGDATYPLSFPLPPLGEGSGVGFWTRETDTMPGFAGSSWYFLRYMDPHNTDRFASKEAIEYWQDVDFYIGGAEHAVGHLMYSRMWHKFLFDQGLVPTDEPYRKLVNQGMIGGVIVSIWFEKSAKRFISNELAINFADGELVEMLVHADFVSDYGDVKNAHLTADGIEKFKNWRPEYAACPFIFSENSDRFQVKSEVGKMSKSKYNVVNPDEIIDQFGADCFRMYEMFLGPIEQSKPWDTKGITGVSGFLRKFWSQFFDEKTGEFSISNNEPTKDELKILHTAIKKITEDIERFSMNTCVSNFMIATNDLRKLNCSKRSILEPLVVLLAPFAPHISEELWHWLGHATTVCDAAWPVFNDEFLKSDTINYPIQVNGKLRANMDFPAEISEKEVETAVLALEQVQKWMEGRPLKKLVFIKGRMVNVVV